jgi:hypothetical protein
MGRLAHLHSGLKTFVALKHTVLERTDVRGCALRAGHAVEVRGKTGNLRSGVNAGAACAHVKVVRRKVGVHDSRIGSYQVVAQFAPGIIEKDGVGSEYNIVIHAAQGNRGLKAGESPPPRVVEDIVLDRDVRQRFPEHDLARPPVERECVVGYQHIIQAVRHLNGPSVGDVVEDVIGDCEVGPVQVKSYQPAYIRATDVVEDISIDDKVVAVWVGIDPSGPKVVD